ncbi:MAG TPA: tetratricopeptide repeat protein, partial [Longimicrobiales bacterium]|nr:tetratricopeptide repeat protein [Longimicrobiales bacterium]
EAEDDDPLGLAAHLAGMGRSTAPPSEPVESDWLDSIADDEPDAAEEEAFGDSTADEAALNAAGSDADTAEQGSAPSGSVEDVETEVTQAESAAQEMAAAPRAGTDRPAPSAGGEEYIDLGAFITGDEEEESTRFRVRETAPTGDEDRDFAELLSQFKSKVHEHLPPEDAVAHYDLGLAFKEMGLIDEAIGEFQIALRAGHMRLRVYEELGQCFLQKEQFNIAEKVLSRALTMKFDDELELLGVYYHLGRAYEAMGQRDQARDAYERVLGMDINFGDVTDRLARL